MAEYWFKPKRYGYGAGDVASARDGGGFAVPAADGQKPVGVGGASHIRCSCRFRPCDYQPPQNRRRMALARSIKRLFFVKMIPELI